MLTLPVTFRLRPCFSKSAFALTLPIWRAQRTAEYKHGTLFKGEGRWIWRLRNEAKKLKTWEMMLIGQMELFE